MCLLTFVGMAASLPSLSATTLVAGQTASPDVFTAAPLAGEYTLQGTTGTQNVDPIPGTSFNATYTEWVYADTLNVFCAGCLDFFIDLSNAGPGILERISTGGFVGFSTDVGYSTVTIAAGGPTAVAGGVAPFNVDRSGNGNVIGFNYIPTGQPVNGGQSTVLLEIQVNTMSFTSGNVSVQDGSAGFANGFSPTTIPEPVSMALLGSGLIALGLMRKRFGL
jgi:hypothetical protein